MTSRHFFLKKETKPLIIRVLQIKMVLNFLLTALRMAAIQKTKYQEVVNVSTKGSPTILLASI